MKVIPLRGTPGVYSCTSYLVLGDMNRLDDVNALVDVGTDGSIVAEIATLSTGVGKSPVQKVVLTHDHFDHSGGLGVIRERYVPVCCGFGATARTDRKLEDGEVLRLGDRYFEVIHSPGHTEDSICLYCRKEKVLFSGDSPLSISAAGGSYTDRYLLFLDRLAELPVDVIYPGHGVPIVQAGKDIRRSLRYVSESRIIGTLTSATVTPSYSRRYV